MSAGLARTCLAVTGPAHMQAITFAIYFPFRVPEPMPLAEWISGDSSLTESYPPKIVDYHHHEFVCGTRSYNIAYPSAVLPTRGPVSARIANSLVDALLDCGNARRFIARRNVRP